MRPSTLARAGAVATAATLALSLGAGSATAAESTSVGEASATAPAPGARPAATTAPGGDVRPAAIDISKYQLKSGVITSAANSGIYGDVVYGGTGTVNTAKTEVRINGVLKGELDLYDGLYKETDGKVTGGGVDIPREWGSGAVVLGPTTFTYKDSLTPTVDEKKSNTFYLRKNIKTTRADGVALKIRRVNKNISFKAQEIKIINPSTGKYVSAGSVKLQYKSGSTWRTKKTIKLNSSGNGSYSRTTSSKYRYRLFIAKTDRAVQFSTRTSSRL